MTSTAGCWTGRQSAPEDWDVINLCSVLPYGSPLTTAHGCFTRALPHIAPNCGIGCNLWTSSLAVRKRSLARLLRLTKEHYGTLAEDVPGVDPRGPLVGCWTPGFTPLDVDNFLCIYSPALRYYVLPETCNLATQNHRIKSVRVEINGNEEQGR